MTALLQKIRNGTDGILVLGSHRAIVQSILDFDFMSGKKTPSVVGIITKGRTAEKYFFGTHEVLLSCYSNIARVPKDAHNRISWMLNLQSGRRAFESTVSFFGMFPHALGGHIFAENVPEMHATNLINTLGKKHLIFGPSGVGLLVPGALKLGAIGGVDIAQITASKLNESGSVAVVSTSGGMTSELIRAVADAGKRMSFAVCVGGDRFPVASLTDVLTLAEEDKQTSAVVYFGELGGVDEYEIVELIRTKKFTKPLIAYIAGIVDEAFDEHVQFGHAKALVARSDESARAKRQALRDAGQTAPDMFPEFLEAIARLPQKPINTLKFDITTLMNRQPSILSTRKIVDVEQVPRYVVKGKLLPIKSDFAQNILEALLGRSIDSPVTKAYADAIFSLLIDHGGEVSGAVNTMITARAGKDLVSSVVSGLLTVGPRFGGAINDAARLWVAGVAEKKDAKSFVESETKAGRLILGIGHRKYRVGVPDPRVAALSDFASLLKKHPHYDFARSVEKETTAKNGKLILNIDGVIAALMLDILMVEEGLNEEDLRSLVEQEFFNALFVIPRTTGFIAHFMEQKKNDEGLFRLPEELLFVRENPASKKPKKK